MKFGHPAPTVAVTTLGCKVNQYESAALIAALEGEGFCSLPFTEEADCYIINTCTVTGRSDYQSRQLIRRAMRRNPQALIVVTGCYVQTNAPGLADIAGIHVIAGNREKMDIPGIIAGLWTKKCREGVGSIGQQAYISCHEDREAFRTPHVDRMPGHTRGFLEIQDGCNACCSYCIVPDARGRSRSLERQEAIHRITRLAGRGYREIVLTGIHLGSYGQDLSPPDNLAALLRHVEENRIVDRIRLSSIEPREVTDDILNIVQKGAVICPHLHVPLQSGDDAILSLMNRDYDTALFGELVQKIVATRSDMAVGMDVMVGFPGEDERSFETTYRFIEGLPVAYLHVFPYSKRPGTKAGSMKNQVKEEDKKRRAEWLRALGKKKQEVFMERFLGRPLQVLIEGRVDRKKGMYKGFSGNYLNVLTSGCPAEAVNTLVTVIPYEVADGFMVGNMIHE